MEIVKDVASVLNPIFILFLGWFILRRVESIKNQVSKQYEFSSKWANEFFKTCQEYMNAIEKNLSLLHFLNKLEEKNSDLGKKIQKEITELNQKIPELQLRLKRLSVFAYKSKGAIIKKSESIQDKISNMLNTGIGNFDEVILLLDEFNKEIKKGHF